jgi:transcriptional regulator with XRE-family HTH domain
MALTSTEHKGPVMKFKDVLIDLRKRAGLTQEALAAKAGLPVGSLRCHEQGQRLPSWVSVVKLARALGVLTDVLAECDEVKQALKTTRKRKGDK